LLPIILYSTADDLQILQSQLDSLEYNYNTVSITNIKTKDLLTTLTNFSNTYNCILYGERAITIWKSVLPNREIIIWTKNVTTQNLENLLRQTCSIPEPVLMCEKPNLELEPQDIINLTHTGSSANKMFTTTLKSGHTIAVYPDNKKRGMYSNELTMEDLDILYKMVKTFGGKIIIEEIK